MVFYIINEDFHKIPENLSFEQAALVEPMGIAAYAILGKAGVRTGDFVVILGTGPIALLALQMVKAAGASRVVTTGLDADEDSRFKAARAFGADMTINAQRKDPVALIKEATGGKGVDLVIDLSGAPSAILSGFKMLKKDGRFCAIGLPYGNVDFPWAEAVLGAYTVFFSFSSDFRAWEQCLQMMSQGKIKADGFTDNCFSLDDWSKALDTARSGKALKVIIKPS
ncbi:zinc-binding dehydrogenase [Marispirochaeta sp.]|uniref:zinc-dependent alcohol dehydrogenase n=1 Tax=Marispirochaeta sp. TaxID=2038653 RepID=UPI0029C8AE52|nr:zinc-binding dehydrogenase [Marispirochaeta sp.]